MEKKFVMIITHATDNSLRASSALTVANAIKTLDSDLVVFLMNEGVLLAKKGVAEKINHPNFSPAKELLTKLQEEGVNFYLCGNCARAFQVEEKDLIEGAQIAGAVTLAGFMTEREVISL
jgi:predicted peroxiredoxin